MHTSFSLCSERLRSPLKGCPRVGLCATNLIAGRLFSTLSQRLEPRCIYRRRSVSPFPSPSGPMGHTGRLMTSPNFYKEGFNSHQLLQHIITQVVHFTTSFPVPGSEVGVVVTPSWETHHGDFEMTPRTLEECNMDPSPGKFDRQSTHFAMRPTKSRNVAVL